MIRIFGHYVSKLFLLLGVLELGLLYLCVLGGYLLRSGLADGEWFLPLDQPIHSSAVLYALLTSAAMIAMGLYQRGLHGAAALLVRFGVSFFLSTTAMSLVFYSFPGMFVGRGVFGFAMLLSIAGLLLLRSVFFYFAGAEAQQQRVLVLGSGLNAARIDHLVETEPEQLGFSVVKYVRLEDGHNVIDESKQIKLTGSLLELVTSLEINEIVIAVDDRRKGLPVDDILDCKMSGIVIFDLLTFFEKETSRVSIDLLHPSWIYYSPGFNLGVMGKNGKRMMDIIASLIMIILFSPLWIAVTLASLIESRGRDPILYSQVRVGENGRHFRVYKFRSMRTDAEADGVARWATTNDSRVTILGAFIRKTRLDEIPQLINVLKGDMSLVGPRPERPEFVLDLEKMIPYYRERHRVKPGLTGWAQLRYQYGSSLEDAKQKLQYDLYYVKNSNLFLDMVILLETVEVVLMGKGAR
ncbi:MAG: TIGR03013 family PEP-CTERM/XrtA system glycosyltransferase [Gammaproteobacteria bacterium]|nr:TIGR03013 family PEP-CTERM/XrtA system glycosyltransferase [Gammaproteobacteria bacterium]